MTIESRGPRAASGGGLHLYTEQWVDAPDAHQRIDRWLEAGELEEALAERLRHFVDFGYMTFSLGDDSVIDALLADVERAWQERPGEIAYARDSPPKRMTEANPSQDRQPRSRLHDLHGWSDAAKRLYTDPTIFEHVEWVYREQAVSIQSLLFEYGSQQVLHRDPVLVPSAPASHLLAAWVALEDIHPDCGPLTVVPGSHRLPYYEFEPGQFMFDSRRMSGEQAEAAMQWDRDRCAAAGLEAVPYLAKRGEVLLWHHSLLHGGSDPVDEARTRKSFVVHFSTLDHFRERGISIVEQAPGSPERDSERWVSWYTEQTFERGGHHGFCNPLEGAPR